MNFLYFFFLFVNFVCCWSLFELELDMEIIMDLRTIKLNLTWENSARNSKVWFECVVNTQLEKYHCPAINRCYFLWTFALVHFFLLLFFARSNSIIFAQIVFFFWFYSYFSAARANLITSTAVSINRWKSLNEIKSNSTIRCNSHSYQF